MKHSFFQAAVVLIVLYGCTTWTLTKRLEKKIDGHYTRMLRAILSKSWRQHPTRHQLFGHLPLITKTIQVRRTRHARHCWRSKDELISDVLLWTPTYGRAKAGRPARTYIQKLCEDTGCGPEDLPEAMTIGRSDERGSGISVPVVRHDDDDDDDIYISVCIYLTPQHEQNTSIHAFPKDMSAMWNATSRIWTRVTMSISYGSIYNPVLMYLNVFSLCCYL